MSSISGAEDIKIGYCCGSMSVSNSQHSTIPNVMPRCIPPPSSLGDNPLLPGRKIATQFLPDGCFCHFVYILLSLLKETKSIQDVAPVALTTEKAPLYPIDSHLLGVSKIYSLVRRITIFIHYHSRFHFVLFFDKDFLGNSHSEFVQEPLTRQDFALCDTST